MSPLSALVISFLRDPPEAISEMARVVRAGGWVATYMWDIPGGGPPTDPIYVALESMGMTSVRPANPAVQGGKSCRTCGKRLDLNLSTHR